MIRLTLFSIISMLLLIPITSSAQVETEVEVESEIEVESEMEVESEIEVESEAEVAASTDLPETEADVEAAGNPLFPEEGEGEMESELIDSDLPDPLPFEPESEDDIIEAEDAMDLDVDLEEDVDLDAEDAITGSDDETAGNGGLFDRGAWDFSLRLAADNRIFFDAPNFDGQLSRWQPSFIVAPEFDWDSANRDRQIRFSPYFRVDIEDHRRTHFDVRELYYRHIADGWQITAGVNKVFWGVTESRHLVDVINQDDFVEDIDREDKLGQPMVNLKTIQDWGTVDLFVLPYFREQTFPGERGRLRAPLVVSEDPIYESAAEEWHTDVAARYSHVFGDIDFGASYFYGTGREPTLIPNEDFSQLVPRYDLIHQGGIDVQYTKEAWLFKTEAMVREGQGDTFAAGVAGAEYTFYQLFESSADLGVLAEYLWDGRDDLAPPTAFQNDLFLGARYALNDSQDTALLTGAIFDMESSGAAIFAEFERRLGENWFLEAEGRFILNGEHDPGFEAFANDSFLTLRLSRYF